MSENPKTLKSKETCQST